MPSTRSKEIQSNGWGILTEEVLIHSYLAQKSLGLMEWEDHELVTLISQSELQEPLKMLESFSGSHKNI